MVSTFTQTDETTQTETVYKTAIDDSVSVMSRLAAAFAPHEQATPNMTVRLDAGWVPKLAALATEVAAQSTGTITAPTTNPRKDITHIDQATGAVGVATGTESASPVDPAVPAGKIAVARINLVVGQTSIVNNDLDDLRNPFLLGMALGLAGVGLTNVNGLIDLDIAGLTVLTSPATGDAVPIEDVSATARRKITLANLWKVINLLTAETAPATDDELALFDNSASVTDKITLTNLLKVINVLTEDTAPDTAADFLLEYDASAAVVKKVLMSKVGGGGSICPFSDGTSQAQGTTEYYGPGTRNVTEIKVSIPVPVAGTFKNLHVQTSVAVAGGQTVTATLFHNGSATSIVAIITAGNTSASDLVNTLAVVKNDRFSVEIVNSAGTGPIFTRSSIEFEGE